MLVMSGIESFRGNKNNKVEEEVDITGVEEGEEEISAEKIKDTLFDQYLKQNLIEDFFDELHEYLDEEAVDDMRGELANYDDEDIYATLSLPKELRHRKFTDFQKQLESENKNPGEVIKSFVEASKRHGFGIGYHTSPNDIKPDEQGRWTIKGFESDHRDDDLSKAYYSTKYRHLFKRRNPKFIYIVRTDPSTHRTDGNWSRAGTLSVVARVPFEDVVEYVEKNVRDIEKKKAGG